MEPRVPPPAPTRLIAMGSAPLMQGFGLIGVETWPDATEEQVEQVLAALVRKGEKALLFLEQNLARSRGHWLNWVRNEEARIVITEIPSLHAPHAYAPAVDRLVRSILGPSALEDIR
ncbi:MAG: V-type ATP synthase subunit F [Betaproteobacteria bacterium]|nr:V-type ATP synthase subunit F [Betaproteobacteria bacterium]